ncbi:interleukin-1 receptor-associated kinase 1 isoform X2 [Xenopus laevis]|uniref:Interleukin-1 receptor-associated kinase 1 isoform X2 n=1 Tax=Xenopus laevis TaxID=8355 RepID=A0A8J1LKC2_XENLA|nr:interleukin-1 receptor-associated kinase 1 isoform X2 [Xenopus laevis]
MSFEEEFLYRVPSRVMYRFYHIMDSLEETDWKKFASMIIEDTTELRLLEQQVSHTRTEAVMWTWSNRNAVVGELLSILRSLNLLRALDVIESWRSSYMSKSTQSFSLAKPLPLPPPYTYPGPESAPHFQKPQPITESLAQTEATKPSDLPHQLPLPGPPPNKLIYSSICSSHTSSTGGSSDYPDSLTHSSVEESFLPSSVTELPRHFEWNFQELVEGTKNFSQSLLIGEGGFGCVYKATMRNTEYAVKRLKQDSELEWSTMKKSFLTEIEKLTCLRHPNIIDLAGYCIQGEEYCLIYLYLPSGSLEDQLHPQGRFPKLTMEQRISILQGAACGLQFLHNYQPSIIHGDVKSSNILLDQAYKPKLGDFGLARFSRYASNAGRSRTLARTSTVKGTLAYLPEEYVKMGKLTFELDTYSFGVVLLENLTGRKAIESDSKSQTKYLKDLVKEEEYKEEEEEEKKGAMIASRAEAKQIRVAARICQYHLDFRVWQHAREVAQELSLLACRCLGRQKKRPNMQEVFFTLKRLQEQLHRPQLGRGHGISLAPPCVSTKHGFPPIRELSSSAYDSPLTPEENTDKYTPGGLSVKGSVKPYTHAHPQYQDKVDSLCSSFSCQSLKTFRGGQNTPVESDESFPDYSGSDNSGEPRDQQVLYPSRLQGSISPLLPRVSVQGPNPPVQYQNQLLQPNQRHYCNELSRNSSSTSGTSQAIIVPHHQIVMNPAKQRFVEQLALYDQGKINSLELLSSGISPGQHSEIRGPEESDDFTS